MATRTVFNSATPGTILGDAYMDHIAGHVGRLYDAASFPLTSVGGTANAVTASLDPVLSAGLVDGMRFGITWAATNTGSMTLSINGASAVGVLDAAGGVLSAGMAVAGMRAALEYIGGAFRVMSIIAGAGASGPVLQIFTSSGTWTKPSGFPDDTPVLVEVFGAGASGGRGASSGGGGGGACVWRWYRMADLPSSVACGIGAGGAALSSDGSGNAGGNSTFGALLTGYGGAGGGSGSNAAGGGGAGELAAGSGAAGGSVGGGSGATPATSTAAQDGRTDGGGAGGGGAGSTAALRSGGNAVSGGGGGGGAGTTGTGTGGLSQKGGAGGASADSVAGTAGSAPGGGGGASRTGTSGAGARGEIRVWVFG